MRDLFAPNGPLPVFLKSSKKTPLWFGTMDFKPFQHFKKFEHPLFLKLKFEGGTTLNFPTNISYIILLGSGREPSATAMYQNHRSMKRSREMSSLISYGTCVPVYFATTHSNHHLSRTSLSQILATNWHQERGHHQPPQKQDGTLPLHEKYEPLPEHIDQLETSSSRLFLYRWGSWSVLTAGFLSVFSYHIRRFAGGNCRPRPVFGLRPTMGQWMCIHLRRHRTAYYHWRESLHQEYRLWHIRWCSIWRLLSARWNHWSPYHPRRYQKI